MLVAVCAVLGLVVGSFLNVVIARVPGGESVVRPGSRCPACGTPIAPRDNVPVLSWLLLRGRARCCGVRISPLYPAVELAAAAGFALVAARWGSDPLLPALLYLAAISVALAVIDVQVRRLPFEIVAPSYLVVLVLLGGAAVAARDGGAAVRALAGGALLWLLYRLLHLISPNGMAYGDVRLSGVLGLYLGWVGWGALAVGAFAGFVVGGVAGVVMILAGRIGLKGHLPYGPYLLAGTWIGLVAGGPIATAYLRASGWAV